MSFEININMETLPHVKFSRDFVPVHLTCSTVWTALSFMLQAGTFIPHGAVQGLLSWARPHA